MRGLLSRLCRPLFGRPLWILCCLGTVSAGALAQRVDPGRVGLPARSARVVSYEMGVRLDAIEKRLAGSQKIRYRNRTQGSTRELRFHLYLNAFANPRSTHLREAGKDARERYEDASEFAEQWITELRLVSGAGGPADLMPSLRYDAPDDGNADDRTVVVFDLPADFEPGTEILLEGEFSAKLPKAYRRTGWGPGNFFMLAQWFPKLGVLEDAGDGGAEWNCHQFHANTEFYADYGTYDVSLDLPAGWPVGATGHRVGEVTEVDGREVHRFVQEDVHDFAWVTDPDYKVHRFRFEGGAHPEPEIAAILSDALGYGAEELRLSPVDVTVLLQPEHDNPVQLARHRRAVEVALRFYGGRFGRYPYPTLTVVDPGSDKGGGGLGGGMEYPTLITCGTPLFPHPRRLSPEGVTVHEFGHQFWYGLSGNNEFEESWLDEGMCSYSEGRAQDLAYAELSGGVGDPVTTTSFGFFTVTGAAPGTIGGVGSGPLGQLSRLARVDFVRFLPAKARKPLADLGFDGTLLARRPVLDYLREMPFLSFDVRLTRRNLYADRAGYLRAPSKDPIVTPGWKYLDRQSYRVNSYPRPSTVLATLERMMGPKKWWPCMRRFHEQARFAHPTTEDFLRNVREFGGDEVAAFARDCFYTTKTLDYGIESVTTTKEPASDGNLVEPSGDDAERADQATTIVKLRNFGELVVPVDVRFVFEKSTLDRVWPSKAQGSWREFKFGPAELAETGKLVEVWVDPPDPSFEIGEGPAGVYVLDANLVNNAWKVEVDRSAAGKRTLRALIWAQTVLSFFGGLG